MFVLGGFGIVIGLMMYGYNIIMQLGVKMLHLTPSRGFSAELAAGLTIALASFYGIPVSTTQIIVGCEVGVALSESTKGGGLGWKVLLSTFLGWIWTILLSLSMCGALFASGAYAPSIYQTSDLNFYRTNILSAQQSVLTAVQRQNALWRNDATWWTGAVSSPMLYNGNQLNATIVKSQTAMRALQSPKTYTSPNQVMYYLAQTSALYANYSITALGQNNAPAVTTGAAAYRPQP